MSGVIDSVTAAARADGLFDGVSRLLVGCSGGGDSVVLLDVLQEIAPEFGFRLAVAHLHHGWRGAEADADQELVARAAQDRGLRFFSRRVDLGAASGSREEAARNARLRFFAETGGAWNADAVALGHTADDQLETIVFRLARGTARRGLGGMHRRTEVEGLLLLRPLLDERRAGLREHATGRDLEWREDSSNEDLSLARNRLRRRLLADLQQINPAAVDNVARAALMMREEEEWLDGLAAEAFERLVVDEDFPGARTLDAEGLTSLPRPLRRRVARLAIEKVRGHCRGISREHVEWVVDAAGTDATARDLPGVRVQRNGLRLTFLPLEGRRLASPHKGR